MLTHQSARRIACRVLLFAFMTVWGSAPLTAQAPKPFLHPLFTDNMVLQRGIADPVWGWTTPGSRVAVGFHGQTAVAVAGRDGRWTARIGPFGAGGPYTLTVTGTQSVTLRNVMVGDVWLCSGQSNMEFGVGNLLQPEQVIAAANNPGLRLFTVAKDLAATPQELTHGQWQPCTPETIKSQGTWNGFSAAAYFFGRDLQRTVPVPIGLLLSSWGGTPAEAWISDAALRKSVPEFDSRLDGLRAAQTEGPSFEQRTAEWYTKNDPGTAGGWQRAGLSDSAWQAMTLPKLFQEAGVPELSRFNGVIWFRKTFDLPAGDRGKEAMLHLLADDNDTTWVNGTQVGATEGYNTPRAYAVAAALLKPTGNVVVVRVLDTGGAGGIWGDPAGLSLSVPGGESLPLAGPWRYRAGVSLAQTTPLPVRPGEDSGNPAVLYNGLIHPLIPFGIKGVIWYQGESNEGRAAQYQRLLPALIGDWRGRWAEGNFPFLIVQLAGWRPAGSSVAEIRQAQWHTALTVPNTGIATAIDIGDETDIHPKNKQEVGRRLALVAAAKVYRKKVAYAGPVYRTMHVSGSVATLTFAHADGGLAAKGGQPLTAFEIAGADKKFVPANAKIVGGTVVVSAPQVSSPTAVRYAWSGYPKCSLVNKAGLPAFPFDTGEK